MQSKLVERSERVLIFNIKPLNANHFRTKKNELEGGYDTVFKFLHGLGMYEYQ